MVVQENQLALGWSRHPGLRLLHIAQCHLQA